MTEKEDVKLDKDEILKLLQIVNLSRDTLRLNAITGKALKDLSKANDAIQKLLDEEAKKEAEEKAAAEAKDRKDDKDKAIAEAKAAEKPSSKSSEDETEEYGRRV